MVGIIESWLVDALDRVETESSMMNTDLVNYCCYDGRIPADN